MDGPKHNQQPLLFSLLLVLFLSLPLAVRGQADFPQLKVSHYVTHTWGVPTNRAFINVYFTNATAETLSFNYSCSNGTAIAGTDYTAVTGSIVFLPGIQSTNIVVPIMWNLVAQPDKYFLLNFSDATNITVPQSPVPITIHAEDGFNLIAGFGITNVYRSANLLTAMDVAPDGRIFVCEQTGAIRIIKNGAVLPEPFLYLDVDTADYGEAGVLGIALDPAFETNHFVYIYYTARLSDWTFQNQVTRYTANGDAADTNSALRIVNLNVLASDSIHNGGALQFGPDGKLYIGVGDNGNPTNSQVLTNLLGKVLRLNADGTIPTDNPFYGTTTNVNRSIWAFGLRNPFSIAADPDSSDIMINDVGANQWEEINVGKAGANYGWPRVEGPSAATNFTAPTFSYPHGIYKYDNNFEVIRDGLTDDTGCAIVGAAIYPKITNGFPAGFQGNCLFGDYCLGWVRYLDNNKKVHSFAAGFKHIVALKAARDGGLYVVDRLKGIFKIAYEGDSYPGSAPFCVRIRQENVSYYLQNDVLTAVVGGSPRITYQWMFNSNTIPGATNGSLSLFSITESNIGTYLVVLSNSVGVSTNSLDYHVYQIPIPLTSPAEQMATPGETVVFTATVNRDLPNLRFQWYGYGDYNWVKLPGQTNLSLTLTNVQLADSRQYKVDALEYYEGEGGSGSGVFYSPKYYSSAYTKLTVIVPPVVTLQPTNFTVRASSPAQFSVDASGTEPLSFQWFLNGTKLSGRTNKVLEIWSASSLDAGNYCAVITNQFGRATSGIAALKVIYPVAITHQPQSLVVNSNATALFTALGTGTEISYQWAHAGTNLAGATNAILIISNVTGNASGAYKITITNILSSESASAWLTVNASPFDADKNGETDLLLRNMMTGRFKLWSMKGANIVKTTLLPAVPLKSRFVGVNDFDKDGTADLLFQNTNGVLSVLTLVGTNFSAIYQLSGAASIPAEWKVQAIADFNQDGSADLLARHRLGATAIYFFSGTNLLSATPTILGSTNMPLTWQIAGVGEFNGDKKPDIVWKNSSGSLRTWFMNGTNVLADQMMTYWNSIGSGTIVGAMADFNYDGQTDLILETAAGYITARYLQGSYLYYNSRLRGGRPIDPVWRIVAPR